MRPLEALLGDAERCLGSAGDDEKSQLRLRLARAASLAGRPSIAEPIFRDLIPDRLVGGAALRGLIVLLERTGRPGDARKHAASLGSELGDRIVTEWLAFAGGAPVSASGWLDDAAAQCRPDGEPEFLLACELVARGCSDYPNGLRRWIAWLDEHAELDPYGIEAVDAWTTLAALAIGAAHGRTPTELAEAPGMLIRMVSELPAGHPAQVRALILAAFMIAAESLATGTVLVDYVLRHRERLDPLYAVASADRLEAAQEAFKHPTSRLIAEDCRAIALAERGGFGVATDIDDWPPDLYSCIMRAYTAPDFLRALEARDLWQGESVGLRVRSEHSGGCRLTFPPTHPESSDHVVTLRSREVDDLLDFAAVTGYLPRTMPAVGRNDACPCGSGLKNKRCCAA
jgi:hypothetical protein